MDAQSIINVVFSSSLQELKENEELRAFYLQNATNFQELIKNSVQYNKLSKEHYEKTNFDSKLFDYIYFVSPRLSKDHHDFVKQTFMNSTLEELKQNQKFKEVYLSTNFGFNPVFEFISDVFQEEVNNFQKSEIIKPTEQQFQEEIFKNSVQEYKKLIDYLDFVLLEINSEQLKILIKNILNFKSDDYCLSNFENFCFMKMVPYSIRSKVAEAFLKDYYN